MRFLESVRISRTIQVLLLLWAGSVILLYTVHHFHWLDNWAPDRHNDVLRVAQALWMYALVKLLWVLAFLVLGYGVGRAVLDLLRVSQELDTLEDDILYSIAVGWGLIGLGAFFLGTLGFLKPALHVLLGLILLGVTHRRILRLGRNLRSSWTDIDLSRIEAFLLLIIAAVALWGLPLSLIPEYGFDSLNSHLPAPSAYLAEGRITFHPEINFNNFPQTVEMWFMESMMLIPGGCGPLLMGICHLLTALAVYALTRRFFGRGPALVATLIYLLIKKVYIFATLAYIDQGLTLMLVLGMYAVLRYLEKPSRALAMLAGLTLGFACGIKYSSLITVVILAVVVIVHEAVVRRNFLRLTVDFALATFILAIVCSPWYIRNWVWFHNPFFPFYQNLFPTHGGTYASLAHELVVDHRAMLHMFIPEDQRDPVAFLGLPFSITFQPFGPYEVARVGVLGPWFLLTLPLIIFLRRIPRVLWAILGLIVATFAWWWFVEGMLHLRYMLPIFSLLAAFSGLLAWDGLRLEALKPRSFLGWLSMAAVFGILVTFFAGVVQPKEVRGQFPILPEERRQFHQGHMPAHPVVQAMNETLLERLGDPSRVAETRVYGFNLEQYRWFSDFVLIGNQVGYADHSDYLNHCDSAAQLHQWLRSYGCDYLIVNLVHLAHPQMALGQDANRAVPSFMDDWEEYFEQEKTLHWVLVYRLL